MVKENTTILPNKEAIIHFQGKTLLTSQSYLDVKAYEHALAFTVAKMADQDLLKMTRDAILSAMQNGTDFRDFKRTLMPYLNSQGWGNFTDDKTLLNRRLRTIYHTNKQTAYAAGRWQRIQQTKGFFPYLQYMPSVSAKKRDNHTRYYGLLRPVDDPIWQSIFPPNGFGCKCWVKQLTQAQAEKLGVSDPIDLEMETVENPRTGEKMTTPKGVHFSFSHNHDRLTALLKLAEDKHGTAFGERLREKLHEKYPRVLPIPALTSMQIVNQWITSSQIDAYRQKYHQLDTTEYPLTEDEFLILRHYTNDGYKDLNLWLNGSLDIDNQEEMLFNGVKALLNQALNRLPVYDGQVTRMLNLTVEQQEQYQIGAIIDFPAFTSTSYAKDVHVGGKKNTRLIIRQHSGRKIDELSEFPSEYEVLIGSPTKYKVRDLWYDTEKGYTVVELEQIK